MYAKEIIKTGLLHTLILHVGPLNQKQHYYALNNVDRICTLDLYKSKSEMMAFGCLDWRWDLENVAADLTVNSVEAPVVAFLRAAMTMSATGRTASVPAG